MRITFNSESNLRTFVLKYRYCEDLYWFEKHIPAESGAEALYDAKDFVESENAKVVGKPKAGNYIDMAIVSEWSGEIVKIMNF